MNRFPLTKVALATLLVAGCSDDTKIVTEEVTVVEQVPVAVNQANRMLSDPFLQLPQPDAVNVVWFTNFEGQQHRLEYGQGQIAIATTTQMSRMMEDSQSGVKDEDYPELTHRQVFRHEATATGLTAGQRENYHVVSVDENGHQLSSERFTLAGTPAKGQAMKILLTSDLQSKVNAPANYQRMVETVGRPDAVFFAGDLVNVPDRASEWFDQNKANAPAFFPSLQGNYQQYKPGFPYTGGEILQHASLFATIGNHEVMGRYQPQEEGYGLNKAFNDPQPRWFAEQAYEQVKAQVNPSNDAQVKAQWIADNSHNQDSYLELFSFPDDGPRGEEYYAAAFGDVFLISMNVSRIWRSWSVSGNSRSKFTEMLSELENPQAWGFGEFLFEQFGQGSEQYQWLEQVLNSQAFKQAKYKVVMAHQGAFGLGDNTVPVLANPILQLVELDDANNEQVTELAFPLTAEQWQQQVVPKLATITEVRYQYPLEQDIWFKDIEPLLVQHGVDLVHIGHSHVWNRAQVGNMHYLESSNVGNSYGAYFQDNSAQYTKNKRASYADFWADVASETPRWAAHDYPAFGDPQGREMAYPTIYSPMSMLNDSYPNLPFVASNDLSVFSVLDTQSGSVKSYVFDPSDLKGDVLLFDEFSVNH